MEVPMTRDEAIAVNGLFYAYLLLKHRVEVLLGAPVNGYRDRVAELADSAHRVIGVGFDAGTVKNAWSSPAALDEFAIGNKRKVKS
jgi:hypothetical protein